MPQESLRRSLAYTMSQQRECAAYLASDGPDKEGAWSGLCDWLMEECLIEAEMREMNESKEDK